MGHVTRGRRTFAEEFPDSARSRSSSNLIAGELVEARWRIPTHSDLRDDRMVRY